MALETQYVVSPHQEDGYPVIYRVILVDGVEVSRGEPDFTEIKAAYPSIIEEYFNAVATWVHELANYLDTQNEFAVDNFLWVQKGSRFFYDFMQKFDYASIVYELPQLAPASAETEETPVTE